VHPQHLLIMGDVLFLGKEKGLGLVAKRTYQPGDDIIRARFDVFAINEERLDSMCQGCGELGRRLTPCAHCRVAHYCSPSCHSADGQGHMTECEFSRRVRPHVPTLSQRMLFRMLAYMERMSLRSLSLCGGNFWAHQFALPSHLLKTQARHRQTWLLTLLLRQS
jgi:hypothetical protein